MAEYITKIRTESGDMQIDYNALANLPQPDSTLSQSGAFADAKATGDKIKEINTELNSINAGMQGVNTNIANINAELQNLDTGLEQHTHSLATDLNAGFMSSADKVKLDGLSEYELPTAGYLTFGGVVTTSNVASSEGLTACPIIEGVPYYENSLEGMGVNVSAAQINKLDGLTAIAEKTQTAEVCLIPGNWNYDEDSGLWLCDEQVQGVSGDSIVFVSPAPGSMKAWSKHGIHCCQQGDDELVFAADSEPMESFGDIIVNVAILG